MSGPGRSDGEIVKKVPVIKNGERFEDAEAVN